MERTPNRRAVACFAAGLAATAATIFFRRFAGTVPADLPAGEAATYTAVFAASATAAARGLVPRTSRHGLAATVVAIAMTFAFAAGLTTSTVGVLACLAATGLIAALPAISREVGRDAGPLEASASRNTALQHPPADEVFEAPTGHASAVTCGATLVRSVRDGREVVEGSMPFEVAPGDVIHVLHVPFWPPLAAVPVVSCVLEGIDGRVRAAVAQPYGVRLEVRLPEAVDEPLAGVVRFVTTCQAARAA